jgi:TP901 family phage tail tape measure protein
MARNKITIPVTYKSDPRGLKKAESSLRKFASAATATAKVATVSIGAIAAVSIREFAKFDAALNKSIAIMGNVSDSMRTDMADAAREVAKATTFSNEQAAESFFFLASAGLDAASSVKAMPSVAKFAQAGMFDMALATDLLTDAQSALGLTIRDDAVKNMENMIRVSDVLVKANTLANATVQQFSEALTNKAGAALKVVGKDIEEGVAVLAAFADQGIKGADAGTKFGIVMRDLQTKALKNSAAFAAMNIAVFDSTGEMNNLGDIIAEIETALDGMSDAQAKATLLQLGFADKSVAAIQAVLGSSEAIKTYEASLRDSAGTTENVAEKQLDTLIAQFSLLKSVVADVGLSIGQDFEPALMTLAKGLRETIEDQGPEFVNLFKDVDDSLKPLLDSMPKLVTTAILPLTAVFVDLFLILMDIVNAILPPFMTLLEALAPLFFDILPVVRELIEPLLVPLSDALMVVAEALIPLVETLVPALINILEAVGPELVNVLSIFLSLTQIALPPFIFLLELLIPIIETVAAILAAVMSVALHNFGGSLDETAEKLSAFAESFRTVFFNIQKFLVNVINNMIGSVERFINNIIRRFNDLNNELGLDLEVQEIKIGRLPDPKIPMFADRSMRFPQVDTRGVSDVSSRHFDPVKQFRLRPMGNMADMGMLDRMTRNTFGGSIPSPGGTQVTYHINVNANNMNEARVGEEIVRQLKNYERLNGSIGLR